MWLVATRTRTHPDKEYKKKIDHLYHGNENDLGLIMKMDINFQRKTRSKLHFGARVVVHQPGRTAGFAAGECIKKIGWEVELC
jgi:hypothetical protein